MEMTMRWLEDTKGSYQPQGQPTYQTRDSWLTDDLRTILDAPLPRCLQMETTPRRMSHQNSARQPSPSVSHTTATAAAIARPRVFADRLLEEGRLQEQRREELQLRAQQQEDRHLRSTPAVTAAAKALPRHGKIEDHLLRKAREAEEKSKRELVQRDLTTRQEAETLFKPQLSAKGKRATSKLSSIDYQENWHARREQRVESRRTECLLKEISEVRDKPDIDQRSKKLAAAKRQKEGIAELSHVDAMLERDRMQKLASWEKSQRDTAVGSNPLITTYAATLQREGEAGDRLYREAMEAQRRKEQRSESVQQHSFTPRISKLAASLPRVAQVEEDLMQRHLAAQATKEEVRRVVEERQRGTHHPAINPVSEAIASRLAQTSKERLTAPQQRDLRRDPMAEHHLNIEPDYRSHSVRSTTSTGIAPETLQSYEEKKHENLRRLHQEKIIREMDGCTFTPVTNTQGVRGSVLERSEQWLMKRQLKLDEQRRANEEVEVKDCTFNPALQERHLEDNDGTIYGGDGRPWGYNEFVSRQALARTQKQEREARVSTSTNGWSPRLTTPQEFHLGRTTPVRSLSKPDVHVPVRSPPKAHRQPIVPPSLWEY